MKVHRFLAVFMFALTGWLFGQSVWQLDSNHSFVEFTAEHIVVVNAMYDDESGYPTVGTTRGYFKHFDIQLEQGAADFSGSKVTAKIAANSIDTENAFRDTHLKSADFFNAEQYPYIEFVSTSFKKVGDKNYVLEGDLTIKGITRKASFDVTLNAVTGEQSNYVSFTATTIIDRFDYGLRWSDLIENGGFRVSNYISITVQANFSYAEKS